LNQQHIAEQLNITPEYLSYLFARDVGQTFSKFIKSYRISRALLLLKEGGVTLKDVAYETGFTDRKYFNKVFHEVMDMTPSEYIDSLNR
ncbi:MAG: helix-turn-helix transcriptional regulator, partial [Lachnospiraceae bacterium]|nr:helix-turn-helix transcriptional regulator [Lachnospiraceae bacterium]